MRPPRLDFASDHTILVSFPGGMSPEAHQSVLRLAGLLPGLEGIRNIHPAYCSILVAFDPRLVGLAEMRDRISALCGPADPPPPLQTRSVEIPVRYGGEWGPDLEAVAQHCRLSADEVVRLHSSADYLVCFLGFAPGYPYLAGMPEAIAAPRLDVPRKRVPSGSVAIGGRQTGIYPVASPGGWRIIGRTPLEIFSAGREPLTLLNMGDHVHFVPIRD